MKKSVVVGLLFAIILIANCYAEPQYVEVDFGEYTYKVQGDWETELSEDYGMNYHYETGNPLTGTYMMTNIDEIGSTPETAEFVLDSFVQGLRDSDECSKVDEIGYIDCVGLSELPSKQLLVEFDFDGLKFDVTYYIWTDYKNIYSIGVSDLTDPDDVEKQIENALSTVKSKSDAEKPNSRKNPAAVGEHVVIMASRDGLNYTMDVVVDEFYRGENFDEFMAGRYTHNPSNGCEYVAVKVTVTFESIDSINESKVGSDDPEISVDAISNFSTYTSNGAEYDNVHYSVSGTKELTDVYEGASTTGYFQFEIFKDDTAPMLVYEPEWKQKVWISLY